MIRSRKMHTLNTRLNSVNVDMWKSRRPALVLLLGVYTLLF